MSSYDDIINLPHHQSQRHARLSMQSRAAQFGAFAALDGHGDLIDENARYTDSRIIPAEDAMEEIATRLKVLAGRIDEHSQIYIEYFVPDERKSGGKYVQIKGYVRQINEHKRMLVMEDGTQINIDSIIELKGLSL